MPFTGSNFPWPALCNSSGSSCILDLRLHASDLLFDVAVGRENVGIAVQIVIEEEEPEGERQQAGAAHRRARRFIHEQAVAFVVIKAQHLVGKIADEQMRAAGAVVIGRHPRPWRRAPRRPRRTPRPRVSAFFLEAAVL